MAALKILREVTACIYKGDEQPKKEMAIPGRAEDKDLNERKNWNSLRDWHQNLYFLLVEWQWILMNSALPVFDRKSKNLYVIFYR